MARNQRRPNLDKSTRDHLTGLEAALAELVPKPRQPDEFTAVELWEFSGGIAGGITLASIRSKLDRSVKNGAYVARKAIEGGTLINLYRKP
jgi:hypothetical protein